MKNFLIINLLVQENIDFLTEITKIVAKIGCNLVHCHSKLLGNTFSITMMLDGSWDSIAKAEISFQQFAKKKKIEFIMQRTETKSFDKPHIPYLVQLVALDKPGIVAEVSDFFTKENVIIGELDSTVQTSQYTGAQIFNLNMVIYLPPDIIISDLRERFILFSDNLDLDAIMEPVK